MTIADLNAVTRANLSAIQSIQREMGTAQRNLATGYRVNTALDGPGAYFTASKLRGRADSLDHRLDQIATGLRTIEAADAGVKAIEAMLNGLGDVARRAKRAIQAGQPTGTPSAAGPTSPPSPPTAPTLSVLSARLNPTASIADKRELARQTLLAPHSYGGGSSLGKENPNYALGGSLAGQGNARMAGMVANDIGVSSTDKIRITVDDGTGPQTATFDMRKAPTGFDPSSSLGTGASGLGSRDVLTVGQLVEGINRDFNGNDQTQITGKVFASITTDGRIRLETRGNLEIRLLEKSHNNVNSWDTLTPLFGTPDASAPSSTTNRFVFENGQGSVDTTDGGAPDAAPGNRDYNNVFDVNFNPGVMWVGGSPPPGGGGTPSTPTTPAPSPTTPGTGLMGEWDSQLRQIDVLAADAGYEGFNLLTQQGGSLRISERYGTTLELASGDETVSGLGLSLSAIGFATEADIDARLAELDAARDQLQAFASRLGGQRAILESRQTFSRAMQDTFETGADALTVADPNAESATLLAGQTRLDLATAALSLSNQTKPFLLVYADRDG